MKQRNPLFFSSLFIILILLAFSSCKKINEATELGSDLIPTVDNINTFADTLNVETYNELFTEINDSTRVNESDLQYLGFINNDPLFGKTTASMFFELKPTAFKYSFPNATDMLIDSVVLVLSYKETYGDTTIPQRVNVYALDQGNTFKHDSNYLIRKNTLTYSNSGLLGTKEFLPRNLNDSVFPFNERASNQLRIRLNDAFGQSLLAKNGTTTFNSNDEFESFFKGFAVVPDAGFGGNAVMGFQLTDTNTKLAIYYNYKDASNNRVPTVSMFRFRTDSSATANKVERDYNSSEINTYLNGTTPDPLGFIQNTPGTYVRVKIPGLASLTNSVIHRAELIVQQVSHPTNVIFPSSPILYLDAFDATLGKYKIVPYDFNFNSGGSFDYEGFGALTRTAIDNGGRSINEWRFTLSRYIQNLVNKKELAYEFRLSSPYNANNYLTGTATATSQIPINATTTKYRVRVGGGNHPTQPMRLRIVYSKL